METNHAHVGALFGVAVAEFLCATPPPPKPVDHHRAFVVTDFIGENNAGRIFQLLLLPLLLLLLLQLLHVVSAG